MKIEIEKGVFDDLIIDDTSIGYDDSNNIYDIYASEGRHVIFGCYGRVMALVSDGKIICRINPLMSAPSPYKIISKCELERYSILHQKCNM